MSHCNCFSVCTCKPKQTELFPELGPQQLQPTGRVTFELAPSPDSSCRGCAFEHLPDCQIPGTECTRETMYRLVEVEQC